MKKFLVLFLSLALISCLVVSVGAADIFGGTGSDTSSSTDGGVPETSRPADAIGGDPNEVITDPAELAPKEVPDKASSSQADIFNKTAAPEKIPVTPGAAATNLKTGGQATPTWFWYMICIVGSAVFSASVVVVDKRVNDAEAASRFETI